MKFALFAILIITVGFACQQSITRSNQLIYIHPSIIDANELGIGDKLNRDFFANYEGRFSGVLLLMPNGRVIGKGGDSVYVSSFYIDATEVCNLHYRAFLQWNDRIYSSMPKVSKSLLPDTSIWIAKFPNEAVGNSLKNNYFRNPAFDYYPVVGVSWKQAQAYALWRTDRINEAILVYKKKILVDPKSESRRNHFGTYNFLTGSHEAGGGEEPMINIGTGEERRVTVKDNLLVPNYRLPTFEELKQALKETKRYSENKALQVFRREVINHIKEYPKPSYYDHNKYDLPYCIIDSKVREAPYHIDENDPTGEWIQEKYTTNEAYIMSRYSGMDGDGRPNYYTSIWVKEAEDTSTMNTFDKEHSVSGSYKSFRCVMPNIW